MVTHCFLSVTAAIISQKKSRGKIETDANET